VPYEVTAANVLRVPMASGLVLISVIIFRLDRDSADKV
jgi:hypothetical protein